jgi:uncharacterized phage protein (TIGR02216 family)
LIALGLGRLRLSPATFWQMSLAEWRAMLSPFAPRALARRELETLMQRYPD